MSCCGKGRDQAAMQRKSIQGARVTAPSTVVFEYVGQTALSIIGPATRTSYRFDRPGARVMVDTRDRHSLAAVPVLRRVAI
jgi:hypothetical protein